MSQISIIESNLNLLYQRLAGSCDFIYEEKPAYFFVNSVDSAWPNFVYNFNLKEDNYRDTLSEVNVLVENSMLPPFLIISNNQKTHDFDKYVAQLGYKSIIRWPAMIKEIKNESLDMRAIDGFRIEILQDGKELYNWLINVNKVLFKQNKIKISSFMKLLSIEGLYVYAGYFNNQLVSTVLVNDSQNSSGLYLSSTLEGFERRGFISALLTSVERDALARNKQYLVLEANMNSQLVYERLGFEISGYFDIFWKLGKM